MKKKTNLYSIAYYSLLVLIRVSVLTILILTVCNWIVLINATMNSEFLNRAYVSIREPEIVNQQISSATNYLSSGVLRWSIAGLLFVGLFCLLPRARRHDKKTIILSTVTILFLLLSTALAQNSIRAFLLRL
jgi:hypothetical protein